MHTPIDRAWQESRNRADRPSKGDRQRPLATDPYGAWSEDWDWGGAERLRLALEPKLAAPPPPAPPASLLSRLGDLIGTVVGWVFLILALLGMAINDHAHGHPPHDLTPHSAYREYGRVPIYHAGHR